MNRLNKSVSKKINKLLLDSGDKYITGQISKEQYIGLINTINALENINVDLKKIIEQAKRVDEMYQEENIKYDTAISYINTASIINGMVNSLDIYKNNIEKRGNIMTKNQIEKFAVGYPYYPTDYVEAVLKVSNFDTEIAEEILDDKEKTLAIWQNGTIMIDGITSCCGYDFGEDAFSKKINIGYCPICGRKIVIKK